MLGRRKVRNMKHGLKILIASVALLCAACGQKAKPNPTFDASAWKTAGQSTSIAGRTVRADMLGDLLAHHDFHGWTRAQLVALLGEPTGKLPGAIHSIYYSVGHIKGAYPVHEQSLNFTFDQNDQSVVDYGVNVD